MPVESVAIVFISFIAASFSWRFIENPFRQTGQPFGRRAIFIGAGGTMVIALAIGLAGSTTEGFAFRYPDFVQEKISGPERYNTGTCFLEANQSYRDWRGDQCFLTRGRGLNVLLWGDSFAAQYAPGIADQAALMTADILRYTASLCPPVFGFYTVARPNCKEFNDHVREVIQRFDIRAVIITGRWEYAFKRHISLNQITNTIQVLRGLGLQVYVIGQSPMFANDVQTLFAQSARLSSPSGSNLTLGSRALALNPAKNRHCRRTQAYDFHH
jgi:hypothetical protein